MTNKELIEILTQYDHDLHINIISKDTYGRETHHDIAAISETYQLGDVVHLEVDMGSLNIHINK